jgi:hypothetical protein
MDLFLYFKNNYLSDSCMQFGVSNIKNKLKYVAGKKTVYTGVLCTLYLKVLSS